MLIYEFPDGFAIQSDREPTDVVEIVKRYYDFLKLTTENTEPITGSIAIALEARKLGRKWVCVEKDEEIFWSACEALREGEKSGE